MRYMKMACGVGKKQGVREKETDYQLVFSCLTLACIFGSLRNFFDYKSQNVF